jgi:N-acetylmuramoyl-L-alanine amidase
MILRKNMKTPTVRELQQLLNSAGFFVASHGIGSPGNESDFFGAMTEKTVIEFQKANGLKPDGVVGSKTWSKLLEKQPSKIKPIYNEPSNDEDFDDPEEEIIFTPTDEVLPTCSNILELINLIDKSKITRRVTRVIFHCTATRQTATVSAIQRYWKEKLKWKSPGYHIIVKPDGSWTQLADFNSITNGVAGINSTSIHISYIGGVDLKGKGFDNRTNDQIRVLESFFEIMSKKLPKATFHGHYEFSNKSCPSYNVKKWIEMILKRSTDEK